MVVTFSRSNNARGNFRGEILEGRVGNSGDYSNSMSFAHPRFVDPFDADVVGERWLLPEY